MITDLQSFINALIDGAKADPGFTGILLIIGVVAVFAAIAGLSEGG